MGDGWFRDGLREVVRSFDAFAESFGIGHVVPEATIYGSELLIESL